MTPEQALKILEDVTSEINMTRKNHMAVLQALQVLKSMVELNKKDADHGI